MKKAISLFTLIVLAFAPSSQAKTTLHGKVRTNDSAAKTRLKRTAAGSAADSSQFELNTAPSAIPVAPPRIKRPEVTNAFTGLVDKAQFATLPPAASAPTLSGSAQNNRFDIGAERNSRTLTLAWESWHKQLSREIYSRWQEVAFIPGRATMAVIVTRDRHIIAKITQASGNRRYDSVLIDVVNSLEGNPGLNFPAGSQRKEVSFEADYIADTNVRGGYSWNKNDYETVQQNY